MDECHVSLPNIEVPAVHSKRQLIEVPENGNRVPHDGFAVLLPGVDSVEIDLTLNCRF